MAKPKKPPAIDIEINIRSDVRFQVLAELGGYNKWEAWGRMTDLWMWCVDRARERRKQGLPWEELCAPEGVIKHFLGPNGVSAILGGDIEDFALGERRPNGMIYVRGSHRFDWEEKLAETASAGGKARAAKRGARDQSGKFVAEQTIDQPSAGGSWSTAGPAGPVAAGDSWLPAGPAGPATPASSTSTLRDLDQSNRGEPGPSGEPVRSSRADAQARDPARPAPEPDKPVPPNPAPKAPEYKPTVDEVAAQERRKYVDEVFERINAARKRLDPTSRPIAIADNGRRALWQLLSAHGDAIRSTVEHVVAVRIAEAECSQPRSVRWLHGGMFEGNQWRNAIAMTVADARRPRAGPTTKPQRSVREICQEAFANDPPEFQSPTEIHHDSS